MNNISSSYDSMYPNDDLNGVITEYEFKDIITRLNNILIANWPCTSCYILSHVCIPCTCGLSLLIPKICIQEAESKAIEFLNFISHKESFYINKIVFKFKKNYCSSWIEISFPKTLKVKSSSTIITNNQTNSECEVQTSDSNEINCINSNIPNDNNVVINNMNQIYKNKIS
jgi:hypothetical protein